MKIFFSLFTLNLLLHFPFQTIQPSESGKALVAETRWSVPVFQSNRKDSFRLDSIISYTHESMEDSTHYLKRICSYDKKGRKSGHVEIYLSADTIRTRFKREYTYDVDDKVLTNCLYEWVKSIGDWKYIIRITNTYDTTGKHIHMLKEQSPNQQNIFQFKTKWDLIYDVNGDRIVNSSQIWDRRRSVWKNKRWADWTYNEANELIGVTNKEWDDSLSEYSFSRRRIHGREKNVRFSIGQLYDTITTEWINEFKFTDTSDAAENLITSSHASWRAGEGWEVISRAEYFYDKFGNLTFSTHYEKNESTSEFETTKSKVYFYTEL